MKDTIRNILLALLAVIIVVGGTYTAIQWEAIVGKWETEAEREVFKQTTTYSEAAASFLADSYKQYNDTETEADKNTMKIAALLLCTVMMTCLMTCLMTGCYERTEETQYTDELKKQISDMYGFPDVSNFFEYSQLKEIYEMRDNPNLICYWYTKNDMTGKWIYQGTCIGYGIPYSTSITAPESPQEAYAQGSHTNILPLAEPNGLYTDGLSTSATWILTTDASGNITPTYVESEITISQTKIEARLCEDWSIPSDY